MTSSATETLETDLYRKILATIKGPLRVIEVLTQAVAIDEDSVSNIVLSYRVKQAPTRITEQHVVIVANNDNKDEPPADSMPQTVHSRDALRQHVIKDSGEDVSAHAKIRNTIT